jgi:hypothetical protein
MLKLIFFLCCAYFILGEQRTILVLQDIHTFKILNKYQIEILDKEKLFNKFEVFELIDMNYKLSDGINTAVQLRKKNIDYFIVSKWTDLQRKAKKYQLEKSENKFFRLQKDVQLYNLDFNSRIRFSEGTRLKKSYISNNYFLVEINNEMFWIKKSNKLIEENSKQISSSEELENLVNELNDQLKSFSRAFNNANGKNIDSPNWSFSNKGKTVIITFIDSDSILSTKSLLLMKESIIDNIEKLNIGDNIKILADDTIKIRFR